MRNPIISSGNKNILDSFLDRENFLTVLSSLEILKNFLNRINRESCRTIISVIIGEFETVVRSIKLRILSFSVFKKFGKNAYFFNNYFSPIKDI